MNMYTAIRDRRDAMRRLDRALVRIGEVLNLIGAAIILGIIGYCAIVAGSVLPIDGTVVELAKCLPWLCVAAVCVAM